MVQIFKLAKPTSNDLPPSTRPCLLNLLKNSIIWGPSVNIPKPVEGDILVQNTTITELFYELSIIPIAKHTQSNYIHQFLGERWHFYCWDGISKLLTVNMLGLICNFISSNTCFMKLGVAVCSVCMFRIIISYSWVVLLVRKKWPLSLSISFGSRLFFFIVE